MANNLIKEKYNSLRQNLGENSKYYHLKSIGNFILYINEFGGLYYKSQVEKLLNDYFDYVNDKGKLSAEDGRFIYDNYVGPLGKIYSASFQFVYTIGSKAIITSILILFIVLFLLKSNIFWYIIILLLSVLICIPFYQKGRRHKVYGFDF